MQNPWQECHDPTQATLTALLPKHWQREKQWKSFCLFCPLEPPPFLPLFLPQYTVIKPAPYLLHSASCKVIFSYLPYFASSLLSSSISFYMYFTSALCFPFPFSAIPSCPLFPLLGHTPTQTANHLILAVLNQACQSCQPSACTSWALLPQPHAAQLCAGNSAIWAKKKLMMVSSEISYLTFGAVLAGQKRLCANSLSSKYKSCSRAGWRDESI